MLWKGVIRNDGDGRMDGRGGYAGGDGEEDWGGVGRGRNKRI